MNELDPFGIIGRTLDGQYRVEAFVGEGSFSAVYRGMQDGLGESCAIKCLKLPGGMEPELIETFVRRFRDESKLHYRLAQGNLNVARSVAAGTFAVEATGQVVPYIVFEWLDGRTLAQEIQVRREVGDGPMVIEEAVRILRTAADALAFAHSQGVVHRDVTPSNLFLLRAAHPPRTKVLDFGLAKVVSDHAMDLGPRAPTMGYLKLFSPGYAAPEQFDQRIGAIGPWTDVYAFAQVLVELLYGRSLCDGDNLAAYAAVAMNRDRRPTPRSFGVEVSESTETVFTRALQIDPSKRFANMGDFWAELTRAVESEHAPHKAQFAQDDEMTHVSSVDEMRGIMDGLRSVGAADQVQVRPLVAGPPSSVAQRSTARMPPAAAGGLAGARVIGAKPLPPRPSQAPGKAAPRPSNSAFARTSVDPQLARARDGNAPNDTFARTSKAFPAPQGTLPATPPWQQSPGDAPPPGSRQPSFADDDESTVIRALDEDLLEDKRAAAAAGVAPLRSPLAGGVDPHAATSSPQRGLDDPPGRPLNATFAMADPMRNHVMPEPLPAPASVPGPWQGHGGPPQHPHQPIPAASGPMASMIGVHHAAPGSGSFPFAAPAGQNGGQPFAQQPFAQQPFAHQGPGPQPGAPFGLPLAGLPDQRGPGGAIAQNYAAPGAPTPPVADNYAVPGKKSSKKGLYIALGITGIVLLTGISFAVTRALSGRGGVTPAASTSASAIPSHAPSAVVSAVVPPASAPPPEPTPAPEPPPVEPPVQPPPEDPKPAPVKPEDPKPAPVKPEDPKPAPVKPDEPKPAPVKPTGPAKFNAAAAASALAGKRPQIAAVCASKAGPGGAGTASVTFNGADGKVSSVTVNGAFAGTAQGGCVQSYFKGASVSPFAGPTGTTTGSFNIPKP